MPKRKAPAAKRTWARIVGREWRVTHVSGETLRPVRDLDLPEARRLTATLPVFALGYLLPVRDLTGDRASIAAELAMAEEDDVGPEFNSVALFRGDRGTEAVVIERHH